jgi:hypothetical protein
MVMVAACAGRRVPRPICQPESTAAALAGRFRLATVLDGRVVDIDSSRVSMGTGRAAPPRAADSAGPAVVGSPPPFPTDSVATMSIVDDARSLARYGLCDGDRALVVVTQAYADRHGIRSPAPHLCIEPADGSLALRIALPVGETRRIRAGELDILHECDLGPPAGVRWTSSDSRVVRVDSLGRATARAPGRAVISAHAGGVTVRDTFTVVPPVARIVLVASDTVVTIGDSVTVSATLVGADGQRIADAPISLWYWGSPLPGTPPVLRAPMGPFVPGTGTTRNAVRAIGNRVGTGWVIGAVVGRVDSLQIRVRGR